MNRKMLISILVIFVMAMGLDFLFHGVLLAPDYARLANLYRIQSDQENHFPFMIVAHVILAIGFVWIYNKGKEEKSWVAQGIRFGLAVAVLSAIPHYLIYYAVQPLPGILVFKQILFGTITFVLMGIVTAGLNK